MAENVRLRREVASLAILRGEVERLEDENARLRDALGYATRAPGRWLAAGVLSSGGGAAGIGNRIRVDKGSMAGVVKGAVVVSVKAACEIETESGGLRGILSGGDDDVLVLKHLMGDADVPPRSRVLTSGRGGVFPRGIEVGTLIRVRCDSDGLALEGEVLPSVDYSTLEDVFIRCAK